MALEQLNHGVLFEATRQERQNRWRIVHSGEGDVRAFFDDLEESVGDAVEIEFQRLTDAASPVETTTERDDRSPEQEEALQAAVEHGYYETPRETDVGGLADRLDVPRSTLNHRLRRAEEHLAKQRVAHTAGCNFVKILATPRWRNSSQTYSRQYQMQSRQRPPSSD